ncbi:tRNA (cytidine(34)-2'-O)-methyltransferase [Sinimarinibacterium thermocellulolyticum]|uniref:tRNA (cytidine(34)-2'-O)-methyltransferase n=1 Tax=Sinimarinibacterium thermocellulolyticum TaxID=3170016 RepID=A0ABV2A720_9GAMM
MIRVVLYQPEIPPNTGNVMRLCANTGAELHLIEPLGFAFEDRHLRRAGLDYRDLAVVRRHASLAALLECFPAARLLAFTTRGRIRFDSVRYGDDDLLLFGPETRGLPQDLLDTIPERQRLYLPMRPGNRSLNLSNSVAVAVFEVWRQRGFDGARS